MYTSRTGSDLLPTLIIAFQSLSQLPQVCHVFFSNLIQCFSFKDFFQSFVKFNSRFKSQTRAVVLPIPPLLSRFSPSVGLYTCQKSTCSEIVFKKISFCREIFLFERSFWYWEFECMRSKRAIPKESLAFSSVEMAAHLTLRIFKSSRSVKANWVRGFGCRLRSSHFSLLAAVPHSHFVLGTEQFIFWNDEEFMFLIFRCLLQENEYIHYSNWFLFELQIQAHPATTWTK